MKTTIKIKLLADGISKKLLLETMEAFNDACNEISATCFSEHSASKFFIQKLVYHQIREKYNLSAQLTIRAIAKTCEAYKLNKKVQPKFKKRGCVTYDPRILTFNNNYSKVSMNTLRGRNKFDILIRDYFKGNVDRVKGQVDLIYINSEFWLYATCEMPEDTPLNPDKIIGVDLGVKNIAVTSDGDIFASNEIEKVRLKYLKQRSQLQSKNKKASKRKLREISGKERRFRSNLNHCISKKLVEKAKDTNSAIALEDLTGINKRTTVRKSQRAQRHSWSFYQLRQFLTYKAMIKGVPVIFVDPRNTSRQCNVCKHIEKSNRKSQELFLCKKCGYTIHADYNAAINIAARATSISLLSSAKQVA